MVSEGLSEEVTLELRQKGEKGTSHKKIRERVVPVQRSWGYPKLCLWEEQNDGQCGWSLEREPETVGGSSWVGQTLTL